MGFKYQNKSRLYRYYLRHNSLGTIFLYNSPKGWKDDGFEFSRSSKYFGMFRSRSALTLKFIKEGRRFLLQVIELDGLEGNCEFIVQKFNTDTYAYEDNFTGIVDISTKNNTRKEFSVKVLDSSFNRKVRTREDIPIKLFDLTSIDGLELPGFTNEGVEIALPAREDLYRSNHNSYNEFPNFASPSAIGFALNFAEDESMQSVIDTSDVTGTDGAFVIADRITRIDISAENATYFMQGYNGVFTFVLDFLHYNTAGILQETRNVLNVSISSTQGYTPFSYSESFNLLEGDYVILRASYSGTSPDFFGSYIDQDSYTIQQDISIQSCIGYLIFETFARIIQSITDNVDPLRSSALGRTDSQPYSYSVDGDESLSFLTNGRLIRQFPSDSTPLSISLSEAFQSASVIGYLGLGTETIDGDEKIVVEDLDYFFDERVILTIENAKDVSTEYAQDYIFNSIKTGYNKLAYEKKDGILEYNNKSQWSTTIKSVKNELDLVSKIRADNAGINNARLQDYSEFPTTDTQYDEDNFIIDLVRGDNGLLNGRFNDWTGIVPDDWTVVYGTMEEKEYLGDTRCRFDLLEPVGFTNTARLTQNISVVLGDSFSLSLVYKFISEIPSIGTAGLVVEVGGYRLKSDGTWLSGYTGAITIASFEDSVTEIELQSFDSFSIIADNIPVTGTLLIQISTLTAGFIIDNVIAGDAYMKARTTEGFDSISGTVNDEKSLNIRLSPARILRKWGSLIRAAIDNYVSTSIVYNKSDKNSNLEAKETGGDLIVENENVLVNDLNEPRITPEYINFVAPMTQTMISIINDNWSSDDKPKKYGIIKVKEELTDTYLYGWIDLVKSAAVESTVPFRLIMVNTNNLTPVL